MDKPSFSPSIIGRIIPSSPSSKDESGDWRTWGDSEVDDFVNNTRLQGVVRVFGPSFCEELPSLIERKAGSVGNKASKYRSQISIKRVASEPMAICGFPGI